MNNIQPGEVLISSTGKSYYVVDSSPEMISLKRLHGYTFLSCHPDFLAASFRRKN